MVSGSLSFSPMLLYSSVHRLCYACWTGDAGGFADSPTRVELAGRGAPRYGVFPLWDFAWSG